MEAGTHSRWVSRFLQELGLRVIVANPRKTRAIYQNERKSDRRDAMMLARLARMDPTLLHPVEHGSQEAQQDMLELKLRDSLVRARVALINAVRFTLKSLGYPVSNPSSERFHKLVLSEVPESIGEMIAHNVAAIAELTQRIKALDVSISRLAAERYPETIYLQQVSGVGPITSLYFVLKVGNPGRFQRTRDIGAFLGLCPRRDQCGETPQGITHFQMRGPIPAMPAGECCAVYPWDPSGPTARCASTGYVSPRREQQRAKKRAVVAVARKLAVLLLTLWKSREP